MNDASFGNYLITASETGSFKNIYSPCFLSYQLFVHAHAHFSTEVLVPFIDFFEFFYY